MKLNNPLILLSIKFLGIGVYASIENVDDHLYFVFNAEAIVWSYVKKWGLV